MARIRTIKPDAFTSDTLSEVSRGTRWTFAGLWTYADDAGRARDDARLVKAALYPLDDDMTLEVVVDDLEQLHQVGAICRYEVDGKRFLHMPRWSEHQRINRPTASKLPPCPEHEQGENGHVVSPHDTLTEDSLRTHRGKGKEGKGKERNTNAHRASATSESVNPLDHDFDDWWQHYPRKVGKGQARKAYRAARKKVDHDTLVAAIKAQAMPLMAKGPEFCPHPSTWLNGERWADQAQPTLAVVPADDPTTSWMRRRPQA